MYTPIETKDYEGLQEMFLKNGLEGSDKAHEGISSIKCWEIREEGTDERIAGLRLEERRDEFIIAGICADERYRKQGLGSALLNVAIDEVKQKGGKRILLVAKVPGFFKKAGFTQADTRDFKGIINCVGCEQLNKDCFPEFMSLEV